MIASDRRRFMTQAAGAASVAGLMMAGSPTAANYHGGSAPPPQPADGELPKISGAAEKPKDFILVAGAFAGGWMWKLVAQHLRARGHRIWTPTLTGLGERSHLAAAEINLTTHIQDVVNTIRWEDLDGAGLTLVGHSYGGMVISGVAEKVPAGTVDSFVIIDGAVPQDGQSLYSYFGRGMEGLPAIRPLPDDIGGHLQPDLQQWVQARLTPQPMACFTEPAQLTGARENIRVKTFIKATGPGTVTFPHRTVERIIEDPSWRYEELACGHDTPIVMPRETADALERAALA